MTRDADALARVELARWFVEHDEIDEAARVLAAGDEIPLGPSDYLGLAAALTRRGGLGARYEMGRAIVHAVGDSPMTRRPPLRTAPAAPARIKPRTA
jgi:hypothetical protein